MTQRVDRVEVVRESLVIILMCDFTCINTLIYSSLGR